MPGPKHKNTQQDRLDRKGELLCILDNCLHMARQLAEDVPDVEENVEVKDAWDALGQDLEDLFEKAKNFLV